ncbi:hypothetical protein BDZ97DRAFT_1176720 [Flammula alnicola]|nr:hypothetical protein BDZ97DRAFT_1176720 [Flammula alnicola]
MHNPGRTLPIAGPLAIVTATVFCLPCNVAYFAAASKEEIPGSGRLVAALLFKNVWRTRIERVLDSFVVLSALGNVLSVVRPYFRDLIVAGFSNKSFVGGSSLSSSCSELEENLSEPSCFATLAKDQVSERDGCSEACYDIGKDASRHFNDQFPGCC